MTVATEEKTVSLPQFPDDGILTHSSTKEWNACRRRYYFSQVLGIRRAYDTEPLRVGGMWHTGVGAYESGMPIDEAVAMVRQAYADQECPPYLTPEEYQVEEEKVAEMIRGHHHRWKDDQILTSIAVEQYFRLQIGRASC